jgi:hypothetical protein
VKFLIRSLPFLFFMILLTSCRQEHWKYFLPEGMENTSPETILTADGLKFKVTYFIQGRLKKTEISPDAVPFEIRVTKIKASLLGQEIRFVVGDTVNYAISFDLHDKRNHVLGTYGKEIDGRDIELTVTDRDNFRRDHSIFKEIDYRFRVRAVK